MTRNVTLAGYAALAAVMVVYQLVGIISRRTPTMGQALQPVKRSNAGRLILLVVWLWAGWHLFVRADWA